MCSASEAFLCAAPVHSRVFRHPAHLVVMDQGDGASREAQPVWLQLLQPDGGRLPDRVAVVLPEQPQGAVGGGEGARINGAAQVGGADQRRAADRLVRATCSRAGGRLEAPVYDRCDTSVPVCVPACNVHARFAKDGLAIFSLQYGRCPPPAFAEASSSGARGSAERALAGIPAKL